MTGQSMPQEYYNENISPEDAALDMEHFHNAHVVKTVRGLKRQ